MPARQQAIIWSNDGIDYWRIYTSLGLNELTMFLYAASNHHRFHYNDITLRRRHNEHDGVSNHQPPGCLLNRLFRRRSKKTSKLRVTCLCPGNSPGPVNSPHKGPVTRKMFPFDDVIMTWTSWELEGMFLQQLVRAYIKENIYYPVTGGFPHMDLHCYNPRLLTR